MLFTYCTGGCRTTWQALHEYLLFRNFGQAKFFFQSAYFNDQEHDIRINGLTMVPTTTLELGLHSAFTPFLVCPASFFPFSSFTSVVLFPL